MQRLVLGLTLLLALGGAAFADTSEGRLEWNNGDTLVGELTGYRDGFITWTSRQFGSPLEVHSDFIAAFEFPANRDAPKPAGAFRVETSTGDAFFGELTAINDDTLELESARLGTISLRREFVREVRQLRHTEVLYDGPRWLDGWKVLKAGRRVAEWEATEHGHLRTDKYGGELYHDLPELDVAEINLVLKWTGKPGFQIDFSSPADLVATRPRPRLSLKSWGDDVVAQSSLATADFQHLLKLTERQKELRLRLVWDNTTGEVSVHRDGSRVLGRIVVDKPKPGKGFGILVKNRSDDLVVEQIRLSKWNGASGSEDREAGKGYIRLASGKLLNQSIKSLDAEAGTLELDGGRTVDVAELAVAEFIATGKTELQPQHIRFHDGTEFTGTLESLDDDGLRVKVAAVVEPVVAKREGLASVRCFQGRTNEFDFHLVGEGSRLCGNLRPVPKSNALGWAPIGARNAVPFEIGEAQTIERRMGQSDDVAGPQRGSEVVYLRDNSVLIGDLVGIAKDELTLSTPYTGERTVPVSEVRAAEMLQGTGRVALDGPDWEFLRSSRPLQQSQERLEVGDPVSMRDLTLLHGGKLTFSCAWDKDFVGLLTLHLGTSTKQPRSSIARFTFSNERLSARCLVNAASSRKLPPIPERRATISLESTDTRLTVWVNGIEAFSTDIKQRIEHRGLWLQCGSARGPLGQGDGRGSRKPRLVIERLRVGDGARRLGAGFAAAGDVDMILKLPRNRVKDAPTCVLCSSNGDLLRGDLLELRENQLSFKSRYEQVDMPRSDLAALVWLESPASASSNTPLADSLLITLRDGSVFFLKEPLVEDDQIVGSHPKLQRCSFPLSQVLKIQNSDIAAQSLASIVDWTLEPTPEPKFVDGELEPGTDSPLVGKTFDDVTIPMLDGSSVGLADERGKVIILDFWATWCAPCLRSLPRMASLAATFPADKVRLIAVNQEEMPFTIQAFLASRDLDLEVGLDSNLKLGNRFRVETLPETIIIGPDGVVRRVYFGTPTDLHKSVHEAVTELMVPTD